MLKKTESVVYSGESTIDDSVIATFSGEVGFDGTVRNIKFTVVNASLFVKNSEQSKRDFDEFSNSIWEDAKSYITSKEEAESKDSTTSAVSNN